MERVFYTYGVMALSFAAAYAGYELIDWRCLSAADWAAWFGAIGTIGTLIGTIVLATQERRRRNREARAKARIIIPGITMKLIAASGAFQDSIKILRMPGINTMQLLQQETTRLRSLSLWTADDAMALAYLPNDVATQLMLIKEVAEAVAKTLEFAQNNYNKVVADSIERLENGLVLIDATLRECNIEYHGTINY